MERQAKDGTFYKKVGFDEWEPVTREAKDGTVYKKVGQDEWEPLQIEPVEQQGPTQLQALGRGAAQGATLGFADELAAGAQSIGQDIKSVFTGENVQGPQAVYDEFGRVANVEEINAPAEGRYQALRDQYRQADLAAREAFPKTYMAGEVGGGIAGAFVPGMAAAKGAKLGQVAVKGAQVGAVSGLGRSEAEDLESMVGDASIGGAIGFATPFALKAVGEGIKKVGKGLKPTYERFAARAIGAERGTIKKLGPEAVQKAGRQAIDEEILSPFANTDDLIARNNKVKEQALFKMKSAYDAIDEAGASEFNPLEVAAKIDDELGNFYRSPINQAETRQLENTIETVLLRGEGNIPLREAQALKQELGRVANWTNKVTVTEKERMARSAYKIVSDAINDAAEKGAKKLGIDGVLENLTEGKKLYSLAKTSEEMLANKLAREEGNKLTGLTDWILLGGGAGAGLATGGGSVPATLALLGTKKGFEKYGSQNAALFFKRLAETMEKAPEMAQQIMSMPTATQPIMDKAAPKKTKGRDAWAEQGFDKLIKGIADKNMKNSVYGQKSEFMGNAKKKKLLMEISRFRPGSKEFNKIKRQILEGGK